jgi:hypothetical protein
VSHRTDIGQEDYRGIAVTIGTFPVCRAIHFFGLARNDIALPIEPLGASRVAGTADLDTMPVG